MVKNSMTSIFTVGVLSVLAAMLLPASLAEELTGPHGIIAPVGINPQTGEEWKSGDTYHLIFTTAGTTDATSGSIADYNAFVNSEAAKSSQPGVSKIKWYAVGGTREVNPRDNAKVTAPVYRIDGLPVADGSEFVFYDRDQSRLIYALGVDQNLQGRPSSVWTGSNRDGTTASSRYLGNFNRVRYGASGSSDGAHLDNSNMRAATDKMPMYALSAELTVTSGPTAEVAAVSPEVELGFVSIFNGEDMSGWTDAEGWAVDEGVLQVVGRGEDVWTKDEYESFELRFEYMIDERGNSGVFFRRDKLEIQLLDDQNWNVRGWQRNGSLYGFKAPSSQVTKPAGEWQTMSIRLKGQHLKVVLNGETIVLANLDDFDGHAGLKPGAGRIGFQNYAGMGIKFRNIEMKEL